MAWDQLSLDKPHLVYLILGGFTSLFMLVSLFVKERLYIGEATVATICGVIFGPHAANLLDPASWGNVDQITLECSRIVLVVQCFAVGVELPKYYMEKHWRSVVFLLVPVMTFGWLITSVFIWWMIKPLTWLESLACAACVTATDPVLASSVVGKGKFAKRVPRHLRDLLSAESGCNDGMAFPFIYLALYLIKYKPDANQVAYHWICYTVLYECIFGAVYGVAIGYAGRHAIKWAERHNLVDRESFLVFYFTLALFCAGSGSILGLDDLLVGFAAGVGFSNDGWFQAKTEESHVSNVIDLLLNLAYFVFFGSVIPWSQFNMPEMGMTPWRLVVIAIFVILFRRIPIMVALKPLVPDIKTWREAVFAGHFGPIGVGAIFVALLARAELETSTTTPLAVLPPPGSKNYVLIQLIWPITAFLVISSILVHGSSIAVFTLGKRINTLTLTMSYTQANEDGPGWMNRLPRIASQSKASASFRRPEDESTSSDEKLPEFPPGTLGPTGVPGNFLRRQREEDNPSQHGSRASSLRPPARKKKWDSGMGPGGPITSSAIHPKKRDESYDGSDTLNEKGDGAAPDEEPSKEAEGVEAYQEGDEAIIEDHQGNVLGEEHIEGEKSTMQKEAAAVDEVEDDIRHPSHPYKNLKKRFGTWEKRRHGGQEASHKEPEQRRGPAMAYQMGNTIIVEDEYGEVVKKYNLPATKRSGAGEGTSGAGEKQALQKMGAWVGLGRKDKDAGEGPSKGSKPKKPDVDEDTIRFTQGGRRMSKADFLKQIQELDPKARSEAVTESNAPPDVKQEARRRLWGAGAPSKSDRRESRAAQKSSRAAADDDDDVSPGRKPEVQKVPTNEDKPSGPEGLVLVDSEEREVPYYSVGDDLARAPQETAAQRRRKAAAQQPRDADGEDDGGERRVERKDKHPQGSSSRSPVAQQEQHGPDVETAAERRRREAALGVGSNETDSEDDDTPRETRGAVQEPQEPARIRFADQPTRGRRDAK
ncbi:MAG: hypothetical protein M1832_002407 [Thelocarpon impressellum]|nr:MAG: hypothetical protein M1832_002407 [Thelocarpon impressellum]